MYIITTDELKGHLDSGDMISSAPISDVRIFKNILEASFSVSVLKVLLYTGLYMDPVQCFVECFQ